MLCFVFINASQFVISMSLLYKYILFSSSVNSIPCLNHTSFYGLLLNFFYIPYLSPIIKISIRSFFTYPLLVLIKC